MNREALRRYLLDRQEIQANRNFIERDIVIDLEFLGKTGKIAALTGSRRSGKSMYLLQIARQLALPVSRYMWVDFTEYLWVDFQNGDWDLLYQTALEISGGEMPVFFLDELQVIADFEPGLRYLQNQGVQIFITGSNSRFFERELASSLRGKVLTYRLYPLGFSEFLRFKGVDFPPHLTSVQTARRNNLLEEYITWGGFPEVVLAEREDLKRHLLESYVDTMLLRDVLDRHNIKNFAIMEKLFRKVLLSFTKEFSVHKWYNDFRSQGYRLSKDTLYEYMGYLEESLFVCTIENAANPAAARKIYLVDNGLYQKVKDRPDLGKLWENACFVRLLREDKNIRFWRDVDGEVDFVTDAELIQVTYDLSAANLERETAPFNRIVEKLPGRTTVVRRFPDI